MPGNDDLEKIKERWTEKAKIPTWWEWAININILPTIPEWYCENREPSLSDSISISIIDPETNQRISAKPSIMYSVKSDYMLRNLNIMVDWSLVFSKEYKRQNEDLSSSDIDLSGFEPGTHTITVQAIDAKWNMNSASITVVLEADDKDPPYLVKEQSKKQDNGDGSFNITLIFDDTLSWIPGGSVNADWNTTTFQWRLASFTTRAENFDIEVRDSYGNVLNETINLADL